MCKSAAWFKLKVFFSEIYSIFFFFLLLSEKIKKDVIPHDSTFTRIPCIVVFSIISSNVANTATITVT